MKNLFIIALFAIIFTGCKENDLIAFDTADSYVYFAYPNPDKRVQEKFLDSVYYSFATDENLTATEKQIKVPVNIGGLASNADRRFSFEILPTSDYDPSLIQISDPVIPAGKNQDTLRITIKRGAELLTKEMTLILKMKPNNDFKVGHIYNQELKLVFNDILNQPTWWNTWSRYMGPFYKEVFQKWMQIYYLGADMSPHLTDGTPGPVYYWNNMPSSTTASWYPITHMYIGVLKDYFQNNVVYPNGDSTKERILLP